jgi:hypothetical protein
LAFTRHPVMVHFKDLLNPLLVGLSTYGERSPSTVLDGLAVGVFSESNQTMATRIGFADQFTNKVTCNAYCTRGTLILAVKC